MPPGVVLARANPETGEPAGPDKPKSRLIPFKRGTLPRGLPRRRRWLRRRAVLNVDAQSSICAPISTTRFGGSAKKSVAERALRDRNRNSTLRHSAMPRPFTDRSVSRPR